MKSVSQISQEITTTITPMADGRSRIEMEHIGGESKLAFINSRHASRFSCVMLSSLVSRVADIMEVD